jgi:hypothetical protein
LSKKSKRAFWIAELFPYLTFQKLVVELPNNAVNNVGEDIGKFRFYKIIDRLFKQITSEII